MFTMDGREYKVHGIIIELPQVFILPDKIDFEVDKRCPIRQINKIRGISCIADKLFVLRHGGDST